MTENLLRHETSPYLLQHADNPVHWFPWGPEAFAEAKRSDRPILLSVGYAACHWCHVMAHESFEDPEVAGVMNEHFVNIKLDREERPDVDQIYMNALQLLGEPGGWPLTMFLTPDGDAVWGGTYFPKDPKYGRPGFVQILQEFARLYHEAPDRIAHNRDAIRARLTEQPAARRGELRPEFVAQTGLQLLRIADRENGGLSHAPKFPQAGLLRLAWQAAIMTGEENLFRFVEHSLERMARGGIYDHVGGGFARYTVDERWLIPHFEKMLYDNAQLVDLLLLAWLRSGSHLFRNRIEGTVGWLFREMSTDDGAFAASLDADSEGEEGLFYTWTPDEIIPVLGDDAELFAAAYDISAEGNFEGRSIPNRLHDPFPLDAEKEIRLASCLERLLSVRKSRVAPGRDNKVLADWNGLMIAALVRAGVALARPDWVSRAVEAYRFVRESMTRDGRLAHSYCDGKLIFPGMSGDYAALIAAALTLHEATREHDYLIHAEHWMDVARRWHWDVKNDGFFLAASDADDLTVRLKHGQDDAIPNPNAIMAENSIRLWHLTGNAQYRDMADAIFNAYGGSTAEAPLAFAGLLSAFDVRRETLQIAIVGAADDPVRHDMVQRAWSVPDPNRIVLERDPDQPLPEIYPVSAKTTVDGKAAAYVCVGERCTLPITSPDHLAAQANRIADPST